MPNYKINKLDSKTPSKEQNKLEQNIKAVSGVESVKIHADKSEVAIGFRSQQEPKNELLASAVTKSGFTLGNKS